MSIGELPRKPRCTILKDAKDGSFNYVVDAEQYKQTKGELSPCVTVWWNREPRKKVGGRTVLNEHLVLRQENGRVGADVIILTLGQTYDLIDALNRAVESK